MVDCCPKCRRKSSLNSPKSDATWPLKKGVKIVKLWTNEKLPNNHDIFFAKLPITSYKYVQPCITSPRDVQDQLQIGRANMRRTKGFQGKLKFFKGSK